MTPPANDDENALRDARSIAHMKYTEAGSPTEPANDDPNPFQFIRKDDGIWFRSSEWTQERLIKLVDPGKDEALKEAMVAWLQAEDFGE